MTIEVVSQQFEMKTHLRHAIHVGNLAQGEGQNKTDKPLPDLGLLSQYGQMDTS